MSKISEDAKSIASMVIDWVDGGTSLGTDWRPGLESVISLRLERLRSGGEEKNGVGVKPLEWRHEPIPPAWEWIASSAVGLYCIPGHLPAHTLRFRDKDVLGEFPTIEATKAAAQADYEQRILSALTNTDLSLRAENERLKQDCEEYKDAGHAYYARALKAEAKLEDAAKVLERALIGNPTIESPEDHVQYFVGCIEAALSNLKGAE